MLSFLYRNERRIQQKTKELPTGEKKRAKNEKSNVQSLNPAKIPKALVMKKSAKCAFFICHTAFPLRFTKYFAADLQKKLYPAYLF